MAINDMFLAVSDAVITWSEKCRLRVTRRGSLWSPRRFSGGKMSKRRAVSAFLSRGLSLIPSFSSSPSSVGNFTSESEEEEEVGVWQKKILMGEKCQPLDFSGVIYYDCAGRQVSECPMTPLRTPITSFAYRDVAPTITQV